MRLQQTQLAGAGYGFGAALDLQFVEDSAVVPFDRVQGEEQPLANLSIRESLGNQLAVFPTRVGSMARPLLISDWSPRSVAEWDC